MSSTLTAAIFSQRILRRLNEASTSPLGELTDGSGASTLTTAQAINDYATEAVSVLCRTCWPLRASFTLAVSSVTPHAAYPDLSVGDAPAGATCWQALREGVIWTPQGGTPTRLTFCTETALSLRYPDYLTAAAGTPTHWYPLGAQGIGLYPRIGNSGTITVHGLAVAPPAADSGVMLPGIPDDIVSPYIEAYVCGMLALKNLDDALLAQRAPVWLGEFDLGRKALYSRLDPALAAYFPPLTPTIGSGAAS